MQSAVFKSNLSNGGLEWSSQIEEANREESHALLKSRGAELLKKGVKIRAIALRGDPREEIVAKVHELGANVLVIGSRGMGTFKRAFLGSVSDYCVHHCNCAVIVPKRA
ncbi:hypothetical protein HK102_008541 [Quaeritorhiza haematococci]|nr:hypothetical protein HK102_008541 [Quaeritorhiza haematococci]